MRWWRSFKRWRACDPRPTLWQWIRDFRCALWINDTFVGFSKQITIEPAEKPALELQDLPIKDGKVQVRFSVSEITEVDASLFYHGSTCDEEA